MSFSETIFVKKRRIRGEETRCCGMGNTVAVSRERAKIRARTKSMKTFALNAGAASRHKRINAEVAALGRGLAQMANTSLDTRGDAGSATLPGYDDRDDEMTDRALMAGLSDKSSSGDEDAWREDTEEGAKQALADREAVLASVVDNVARHFQHPEEDGDYEWSRDVCAPTMEHIRCLAEQALEMQVVRQMVPSVAHLIDLMWVNTMTGEGAFNTRPMKEVENCVLEMYYAAMAHETFKCVVVLTSHRLPKRVRAMLGHGEASLFDRLHRQLRVEHMHTDLHITGCGSRTAAQVASIMRDEEDRYVRREEHRERSE
jgi:hypothetical protein